MDVLYNVPNQVIEKFMEQGKKLAFLAGKKVGDITTVTHIVIPIQHEFQTDTEHGKYFYFSVNSYLNIMGICNIRCKCNLQFLFSLTKKILH